MSNSGSPSNTSSHATQTGRPPKWTESAQRKLGRLYVYTTLPINKILDVIQASSPDGGPGKDSANKKLNAMLDKEPRWLHPRTRTDMDRRVSQLDRSPTRDTSSRDAFGARPRPHKSSVSSNGSLDDPSRQLHLEAQTYPPESMQVVTFDTAATLHVPPPGQPAFDTTMVVDTELGLGNQSPPRGAVAALLRRSTIASTGSNMTTGSIQRALSGYSAGFVKQVKRVVKRYTLPANTNPDMSPVSEDRPETADSMRGSWIWGEHAPTAMSTAPPLPGEFLNMDTLLQSQGPCPPGSPEHESKSCLCRPAAEITVSIWMSEGGLSELALQRIGQLQNADVSAFDPADCDVFGNTLLHLLAARDLQHDYILFLVESGVDYRKPNNAGQTFLHLLSRSWLDEVTPQGTGPLITLLSRLHGDNAFFGARDHYGRTFLHVLRSKVEDATAFDYVMQRFGVVLCRDAFGSAPTGQDEASRQRLRRAFTSIVDQDNEPLSSAPTMPRIGSDIVSSQARVLECVSRAQRDPLFEDQHGRNGLHCLAAAILSPESLLRKCQDLGTTPAPQASRKRKRDQSPPRLKHSDSSKERLILRENILHNLLASDVKVNHYDQDGNTVLMAFVAELPEDDDYKVPVSILQKLIESGADVHARNRRGETALHIAVRRGRKLAMRTLVQAGANVHARDANGRSALDVADEKIRSENDNKMYMHFEACRAWLSGVGRAVQNPSVVQEWVAPVAPRIPT